MTNGQANDVNTVNHIRSMRKLFDDEFTGDFDNDLVIWLRIILISFTVESMHYFMRHKKDLTTTPRG